MSSKIQIPLQDIITGTSFVLYNASEKTHGIIFIEKLEMCLTEWLYNENDEAMWMFK